MAGGPSTAAAPAGPGSNNDLAAQLSALAAAAWPGAKPRAVLLRALADHVISLHADDLDAAGNLAAFCRRDGGDGAAAFYTFASAAGVEVSNECRRRAAVGAPGAWEGPAVRLKELLRGDAVYEWIQGDTAGRDFVELDLERLLEGGLVFGWGWVGSCARRGCCRRSDPTSSSPIDPTHETHEHTQPAPPRCWRRSPRPGPTPARPAGRLRRLS
jgi:hypothetical protein